MSSLMFRPSQKVTGESGSMHPDLYRWVRELSDAARYTYTEDKTADYTASPGEAVICDPTGGAFTVTLPLAKQSLGRTVLVKNNSDSTNAITIAAQGDDTVEGVSSTAIVFGRVALELHPVREGVWVVA